MNLRLQSTSFWFSIENRRISKEHLSLFSLECISLWRFAMIRIFNWIEHFPVSFGIFLEFWRLFQIQTIALNFNVFFLWINVFKIPWHLLKIWMLLWNVMLLAFVQKCRNVMHFSRVCTMHLANLSLSANVHLNTELTCSAAIVLIWIINCKYLHILFSVCENSKTFTYLYTEFHQQDGTRYDTKRTSARFWKHLVLKWTKKCRFFAIFVSDLVM